MVYVHDQGIYMLLTSFLICEMKTGIVANNATADVTVDQYHRYKVSPALPLHFART